MKVAVVGCGYVGLVTSVGLATKGHKVIAIDIDKSRIERIAKGIVPFYEPGVSQALKVCLNKGNLRVSSSIEDAADCEITFICVGTPSRVNGSIDLRVFETVIRDLSLVFKQNPSAVRTVVVRSTVVPGTTSKLITPIFQKTNSVDTQVAFNPEFLREGTAIDDFLNPDRIVIGTNSTKASKLLKQLYAPFDAPIIVTTPSTAELAKYASNTLLATLVSFSNEIARLCERTAYADVEDVLDIVHHDRRFTPSTNKKKKLGVLSYLKAGCGFGGSCFPKDLSALIAYADSTGEKAELLKAVAAINTGQPVRVVDMTSNALGGLDGCRIAVLGIAFKGGTDDLRESPGLRIVDELLKRKAQVVIYDPLVSAQKLFEYIKNAKKESLIALTLKTAIDRVDACIIASNAPEFTKLNYWKRHFKINNTIIIDARRILKISTDKGYYAVGRWQQP